MALMLECHMKQHQNDERAHRRDLHAARDDEIECRQNRKFQRLQLRKIDRLPFRDVGKFCRAEHRDGEQQALDEMWIDQGRRQRAGAEHCPTAKRRGPLVITRQRIECQSRRQRQAEQETPMDIGPERHHRQQRERWRTSFTARDEQTRRPQRKQRQRQKMWPRQKARRHARHCDDGDDRLCRPIEPPPQIMREQSGGSRGRDREEQEQSAPAACAVRDSHRDFGQPLMRLPRRAGEGIGEGIAVEHCMIGKHARAGRDVHEGVAVV